MSIPKGSIQTQNPVLFGVCYFSGRFCLDGCEVLYIPPSVIHNSFRQICLLLSHYLSLNINII